VTATTSEKKDRFGTVRRRPAVANAAKTLGAEKKRDLTQQKGRKKKRKMVNTPAKLLEEG